MIAVFEITPNLLCSAQQFTFIFLFYLSVSIMSVKFIHYVLPLKIP